jgi:hypothetical protein
MVAQVMEVCETGGKLEEKMPFADRNVRPASQPAMIATGFPIIQIMQKVTVSSYNIAHDWNLCHADVRRRAYVVGQ